MIRIALMGLCLAIGCGGSGAPIADGSDGQQEIVVPFDPLDQPVTVAVPQNAKACALWRNNSETVAVQMLFMRGEAGGVLYDYELSAGALMLEPAPLFSDVTYVYVARMAGAETEARLVFDLR